MKRAHVIIKAAAALLLAAVMLFAALPVAAVKGEERLYKGSFRLVSFEGETDESWYYSDSYFASSGKLSDVHLRTMSAVLASAAMFHPEQERPEQQIEDILTDIGFGDCEIDYKHMTFNTPETIGSVIAHKTVDGMPLILVAVRGNHYQQEWASNFCAGEEGDPQGFSEAAQKVLSRIKYYREFAGITGRAKYWITGYSRAGAVANLVGRALNEDAEAYGATADDMYVYTFEAPNCSADDTLYQNIHNIADYNDLVPCVYPSGWGLGLNGVKEFIGNKDDAIMAKSFDIVAENFTTDVWMVKKADFLKQLTAFLSDKISRVMYVNLLQEPMMTLSAMLFSKTDAEIGAIMSYLEDTRQSALSDSGANLLIVRTLAAPESANTIQAVTDFFCKHLDKAYSEDVPLTEGELETLKDNVKPLVNVLMKLVTPELYYTQKDDSGKELNLPFYHLLTFSNHFNELIEPHYGSNVFAQLKAEDDHYAEGFAVSPGAVFYNGETVSAARAKELGFSDDDIKYLQNGYDLSLTSDIQPLAQKDVAEDAWIAIDKAQKRSEKAAAYQTVTLTKHTGFRTAAPETPFKENNITLSVEDDGSTERSYAVIAFIDGKASRLTPETERRDGSALLTVEAPQSGVYAVVYATAETQKTAVAEVVTQVGFAAVLLLLAFTGFLLFRRLRLQKHR